VFQEAMKRIKKKLLLEKLQRHCFQHHWRSKRRLRVITNTSLRSGASWLPVLSWT